MKVAFVYFCAQSSRKRERGKSESKRDLYQNLKVFATLNIAVNLYCTYASELKTLSDL